MFENPRRGKQARNFAIHVPKISNFKSSSEQIFSESIRWVPLKTVVNSLAEGIVQIAILCIYMRRIINYDWATVNISVLIQQRDISFQYDIFLKAMRLGVLSWEKLKNCESHDSIESSPGRVKKGSKIHKLLSQVGHGANLKHIKFHMKTTYRPVKGTKS